MAGAIIAERAHAGAMVGPAARQGYPLSDWHGAPRANAGGNTRPRIELVPAWTWLPAQPLRVGGLAAPVRWSERSIKQWVDTSDKRRKALRRTRCELNLHIAHRNLCAALTTRRGTREERAGPARTSQQVSILTAKGPVVSTAERDTAKRASSAIRRCENAGDGERDSRRQERGSRRGTLAACH